MQTATIPTTRVPFAAAVACDPDAGLAALWRSYLDVWRAIIAADEDDLLDLLDLLDELVARIASTPAKTMLGVVIHLRTYLCEQDCATEVARSYALGVPADDDRIEFDSESAWRTLDVLRELERQLGGEEP